MTISFTDKQFLILGMGLTGQSCLEYLRQYVPVENLRIMDNRQLETVSEQVQQLPSDNVHVGSWNEAWLIEADYIVISPGLNPNMSVFDAAKSKGIPFINDLNLFANAVDKPVYAFTGSNGKSTVVDWLNKVLNAGGVKSVVGGNFGIPLLELLEQDADCFVVELSSFQLEVAKDFHCRVGCILNISEDHMDRHGDMAEYASTKQLLYKNADVAISNADDRATSPSFETEKAIEFSLSQKVDAYLSNGWLVINDEQVVKATELTLAGEHNVANALAVLLSASVDYELSSSIVDALKNYAGLDFRCQWIANVDGVQWFNDSKGTNVGATQAAVKGLSRARNIILIVGGVGKGADFSELAMIETIKSVIGFGEDGEKILSVFEDAVSKTSCDTLEQAVAIAKQESVDGDIVLFSPACASFDQYKNYIARGEHFNALVHALEVA